jgi:valyl-tRNA synthetase
VGEGDLLAERDVTLLIDLVSEIRNARASAKLPAADWLETLVFVPTEFGPTFEALKPAIERLARSRPLHRELTPEALEAASRPGDLTIIVGGGAIEAAVRPKTTDADASALERDRLVRDLAEAEGWLSAARERLANESFLSRAPAAVVDAAREREAELTDQVEKLRDRLER